MTEPSHIVFIRVPIPRGDFVDPPLVEWNSTKDEALWTILSGAAHKEVDWNQVADQFQVPVDFLLQQVAYITERHASQVRAQVRKATAAAKSGSSAPSPIPILDHGHLHQRSISGQSQSLRKDSPLPRYDGAGNRTPTQSYRPLLSRNASTNSTVLREGAGSSSRPGTAAKGSDPNIRRRLSSLPINATKNKSPSPQRPEDGERERLTERVPSPGPADPSETSSSDDDSSPAQSRIIRRPPRFQQNDTNAPSFDEEDEDDSEPAFQPFKDATRSSDLGSTLRGDGKASARHGRRGHKSGKDRAYLSQTSDDSAGSGAMVSRPGTASRHPKPPGPLSPRRTAELAGRSPSGHNKSHSSDGTPDMGSSFSDLDDASVTQSALEEALASHMNGAGSSRFSISQAFRSRYTPGGRQK